MPFSFLRAARDELRTVRARVALGGAAVFIAFTVALGVVCDRILADEIRRTVARDQEALLEIHAESIARGLDVVFAPLEANAPSVTAELLADRDRLQAWLAGRTGLRALFPTWVGVADLEGRLVAEVPAAEDAQDRSLPAEARLPAPEAAPGRFLSAAFRFDRHLHHGSLAMGVWIRDADGAPVARLLGALDLEGRNWLSDIAARRLGRSGYFSLIGTDGTILLYHDARRILTPVPPLPANPLAHRALAGFEGSGDSVTVAGLAVLSTFKRVPDTDWILVASLPVDEAYAGLRRLRWALVAALLGGAVVTLMLTWSLNVRLLRPLSRLAREIGAAAAPGGLGRVAVAGDGVEIERVARAFNDTAAALAAREAALADSEAKFSAAFHSSVDAAWIARLDSDVVVTANDALCELLGRTEAELVGRPGLPASAWVEPAAADALRQAIRREGVVRDAPLQLRRADGTVRELRASGVRFQVGGYAYLVLVARDVTAIMAAQREIEALGLAREQDLARLRDITDNLPVAILQADRADRLRFVNRQGLAWLGLGAATGPAPDADADALLGAAQDAETRRCRDRALQGRACRRETRVSHPDGATREVEIVFLPAAGPGAEPPGYYALVTDRTEQKAADAQLRQLQRIEALGQLTGGVAHDFNNLLAIVASGIELLQDGEEDAAWRASILGAVLRATERGAALTRSLLAFARQQTLEPTVVQAGALIRDMLDLLRRTVPSNIAIELVDGAGAACIEVDAGQLQNALVNLVVNARDAMPEGGRIVIATGLAAPDLTLDGSPAGAPEGPIDGDRVTIAVSDSGTGMAPDVAGRIFEPFFTTKPAGRGTGLGLSMVYGFVTQSRGRIQVDSAPGRGTTITLSLPRREPADAATPPSAGTEPPDGAGERVLVVEDDADLGMLLAQMLTAMGYAATVVADAEAALAALAADPSVALVVTDVMLPGIRDGHALAAELAARRPALPVLFMSGYAEGAATAAAAPVPPDRLIVKPFTRRDLARRIRRLLGPRGA